MNELIMSIFENFTVDGTEIPVKYMYYMGHGEPYIVWMQQDADNSLTGDDQLLGYADYYDFDVYSKSNFLPIVEKVKELLTANNFVWQVARTSRDLYEPETGYYHKTLNFAILRSEYKEETTSL
jgi:hypothetical protein